MNPASIMHGSTLRIRRSTQLTVPYQVPNKELAESAHADHHLLVDIDLPLALLRDPLGPHRLDVLQGLHHVLHNRMIHRYVTQRVNDDSRFKCEYPFTREYKRPGVSPFSPPPCRSAIVGSTPISLLVRVSGARTLRWGV